MASLYAIFCEEVKVLIAPEKQGSEIIQSKNIHKMVHSDGLKGILGYIAYV